MKKVYTKRFVAFLLFAFLVYGFYGAGVMAQSSGVQITFVKSIQSQTVDRVASNVLKIVNNTPLNKKLILSYNIPAGWKMVGLQQKGIQLSSGDSAFMPVRVIPEKDAEGNTSYNIGVVVSDNGLTIGGASYTVKINRISNWTVEVPKKKVYFSDGSDTVQFPVHLENKGNSTEILLITLKPDMELSFSDMEGTAGQPLSREISLMPGVDTVMTFVLRKRKEQASFSASRLAKESSTKSSGVRIHVKETGSAAKVMSRSWSGGIHAYTVPSNYDVGESLYGHVPMSFEWNTYNILDENTYSHLSIFGDAMLSNNQSLAYYYQSNFSSNYLQPETYLGDYHYLGYNSKYFGVEIGNIGAPRNSFMLNGKGINAHAKYKGHRVDGIYIRSPELFGRSKIIGYGGGYSYIQPKGIFKVNSFVQERKDDLTKIDSRLGRLETHVKLHSNHFIRVELGGSQEFHRWDPTNVKQLDGYTFKLDYHGAIKRFRYSLRAYNGSKNYSAYRGIQNYAANVRYGFQKGYAVSAGYNKLNYDPELYAQGMMLQQTTYTERDIYQLRFSKSNANSSLIISPRYQEINSSIITSSKSGLNVDYRYRPNKNFVITTKAYTGYVWLPQYQMKEFFTGRLLANVRYGYFSANIRYYYGPYLSREKIEFAETGDNPQKLFANIYYDWWFMRDKFLLKANLNYNYMTLNDRSYLTTRPELYYYTDSKFRFSIYGRYVFASESRAPINTGTAQNFTPEDLRESSYEFGFGIRKDIFIPASFGKNSDLEVIAFKDVNGNGKQDPDEPGLNNMLITVKEVRADSVLDEDAFQDNKYETITNGEGRAVFSNMPNAEYELKAQPLESMGGWYDGKTMLVDLNRSQKLLLPLNKGGRITGQLSIEKANFSRFDNKVNISNIRVTAFRENGKSFSALTDGQGGFDIYVPAGKYIVTLNEAALGKSLSVVQNNQNVELTDNVDNINVNFYVVEKQRKLNIKRFDKVGGLKPQSKDSSKTQEQKPAAPDTTASVKTDSLQETVADTTATVDSSEQQNYIPVQEFDAEGKIYTVQLLPAQESRMSAEDFSAALQEIEKEELYCIPDPDGNYIFVAGKFEKTRQANRLLKKLKESYPEVRVIEIAEGNLIKEI